MLTLNFSKTRLHEFSRGRHCVHRILRTVGINHFPLLVSSSGSPIWPKNFVGSITHTNIYTAAVLARSNIVKSIGIDIEEIADFPLEIKYDILRFDERREFDLNPNYSIEIKLALFFSIKEAVYKAYNPIYRIFLDFKDVKVELSNPQRSYRAYVSKPSLMAGSNNDVVCIEGFFFIDRERIYTSAWINI